MNSKWRYFQLNFERGHPDEQDIVGMCPECSALVLAHASPEHSKWHESIKAVAHTNVGVC